MLGAMFTCCAASHLLMLTFSALPLMDGQVWSLISEELLTLQGSIG